MHILTIFVIFTFPYSLLIHLISFLIATVNIYSKHKLVMFAIMHCGAFNFSESFEIICHDEMCVQYPLPPTNVPTALWLFMGQEV